MEKNHKHLKEKIIFPFRLYAVCDVIVLCYVNATNMKQHFVISFNDFFSN